MSDAPQHPKRFYKTATVTDANGVLLDARNLNTPGGARFLAPTRALADAVAAEWDAQGERIVPSTMPLTQLGFAALDWTPKSRDQLAQYVANYVETDLVAHRADSPVELVARQAEHWDPLLAWATQAHSVALPVVTGVIAAQVDPQMRVRVAAHAASLDDFRLTALGQAAGLAGSAIIALAMLAGRLDAEAAYQAGSLDMIWSLEKWGEDAEGRAKLDSQRAEFHNIARFVQALT
jgi:chaperone required for assembly of F1-ATPase